MTARRRGWTAMFVLTSACAPAPATPSDAGQDGSVNLEDAARDDAFLGSDVPIDAAPFVPPPPPPAEPGRHRVEVIESRRIVPSTGLPAEAAAQTSNNNLDVIRFEGRTYLAFRTGPFHFASADVRVHIVSSTDEVTWRFEHTYVRATDLREPRFLVTNGGALMLYLAELGTDRRDFEPMRTLAGLRDAAGSWGALTPVAGLENAIVWRVRTLSGATLLTAYFHGEQIYDFIPNPTMPVQLLITTDGLSVEPHDPTRPVLYTGGASETDFSVGGDGSVFGVMRLEAGDANGFGSRICHTDRDNLAQWTCRTDPRKYDSPLTFSHDGEHYLVGRRNVTETGNYDLMGSGDLVTRLINNQLDYIRRPKRCSLWRYVPAEDRVAFVLDLPSRGDTCFASVLPGEVPGDFVIYNYTSDPDGADVSWSEGQEGPTFIYRHVLRFSPR